MPTALYLHLRPRAAASLPSSLGRAAHAAVLRWIAAADAPLAERLHNDDGPKPLTVSSLLGLGSRGESVRVTPEHGYGLRLTLLSSELEHLAAGWTPEALSPLDLDGHAWDVEAIARSAEEHPWAGSSSYEGLAAPALLRAAGGPTRWKLEFDSPVTFRRSGINLPLPLPELVFGSLLDKWNAFAPLALPEELRRFAQECLALNRFVFRSQAEPAKQGALQIGAIGHGSYVAVNRDRYWTACVDVLAHYAFYSGVGAGAARGFGRTRLVAE